MFFTAGYAGKRFIYERAMQLGVKSVAQLQKTALNKRSNGKNRFCFVFWIDIFCIFCDTSIAGPTQILKDVNHMQAIHPNTVHPGMAGDHRTPRQLGKEPGG